MDGLITGAVTLLLFMALISTLPFLYAAWRRVVARDADLQIWRVMRRRGLAPDGAPLTDAKVARAVRRCVLCPSLEECDHWLASGKTDGLAEFCPNAGLFEDLNKR